MAVPMLHRSDATLSGFGPWEPARRYWRGNAPELDVVARSVDGRRLLVGEVKWSEKPVAVSGAAARGGVGDLVDAGDAEVCRALFAPVAAGGRPGVRRRRCAHGHEPAHVAVCCYAARGMPDAGRGACPRVFGTFGREKVTTGKWRT